MGHCIQYCLEQMNHPRPFRPHSKGRPGTGAREGDGHLLPPFQVMRASRSAPHRSLAPSPASLRRSRARLSLGSELALAALPTATVLGVLALVHALTRQPLLTASLAASAFLIYLDPEHGANRVEALIVSQTLAVALGWGAYAIFGPGYLATAVALVGTIFGMVAMDLVHPPAVATAMSFALRTGSVSNVVLFLLALGITVVLIVLQRAATWALIRFRDEIEGVDDEAGEAVDAGDAVRSTPSSGT